MHADPDGPIGFLVPGQSRPEGLVWSDGVRGTQASSAAPTRPGRVKAAVQVAAVRASADLHRLVAVPGEDIVALHLAGGPVLLLHPVNARDLMLAQGGAAAERGIAPDEVTVTAQLRWHGFETGSVSRGGLGHGLLAGFEVLTGLLDGSAADVAAGEIVRRVDGQVTPGLYRLSPDALQPLAGSGRRVECMDATDRPALVFLHGTFVETSRSFGKLWLQHPGRVRELFEGYADQVYALDHATLGQSPIANAIELVRALPPGQRLHLITHSRGGLVAEVLARLAHAPALGDEDLAHFAAPAYAGQLAELHQLADLLAARRIRVERIVRVACPARGTLLAARRLDAYLSVLTWGLAASGVPVIPALADFVADVARRRADPQQIPGLAAMIPETPLLNWLNTAPEPIAGELRVVAGDLEGDSVSGWLKTLVADAYFWTDNDLVVHTRSMYAGAPRAGGASFLLDQGGRTTHFAYFANARTADAIVDAAIAAKPPAGFQAIGQLSWSGADAGGWRGPRGSAASDPSRPAVFLLPGILGSNLKAGGHRIWLSMRLLGGLRKLAYEAGVADGVEPDGAISFSYDALLQHLAASHDVREFAYDWRCPLEDEARRLAGEIDAAVAERGEGGPPVRVLAHSMGGLLARTVQLVAPAVWARWLARAGARLVMLGTPNGGSWAPMQVLSGDDTFGNVLAAFGSPLSDLKARRIMAAMPGFLQLQAGLLDSGLGLERASTWQQLADNDFERAQALNVWHGSGGEVTAAALRWGVPPQAVLDAACALRRQLDAQLTTVLPAVADRLLLVLGQADNTPVGFSARPGEDFAYLDSADGDGRVPHDSALLPGVRTWRLAEQHGSLPSARHAFDAFTELLVNGETTLLPPWTTSRGAEAYTAQRAETVLRRSRPARTREFTRPARDPASVFAAGAGTGGREPSAPAGARLDVELLNGNLAFVGEPLLVGHYRSSELTGTEAVVDKLLGGALRAALELGLYPDATASERVFVNTSAAPDNPWRAPRPHSVVVIGLGDEGALREAALVQGVERAVQAWALRAIEDRSLGAASISLAATLVGSGGLGITPAAAARAIVRGVRQGNEQLAALGWPQVSRLTLVELYLDRAAEAWQGLQVLAAADVQACRLAPQIRFGTGPLRRQIDTGYRGAGYDLVSAIARRDGKGDGNGDGEIEFALDSRRARTELRAQNTQLPLVREIVRQAATDRAGAPGLGRTLFQLLVPVEMEPFFGGAERMVLDLDSSTAGLPWELLDGGALAARSDPRPWAIRSRLVRRLRLPDFRARPQDAGALDGALVIGEPRVDTTVYPPLPGARREGEVVAEVLRGSRSLAAGGLLALTESPDASTVISALLSRPWRIVHVAGHGEVPADPGAGEGAVRNADEHGVVLSMGCFLGPNEVLSMRTVPELVFLNCCHLGARARNELLARTEPPRRAARIAERLIGIGVRCVIVAGWAVEDEPAYQFARRFYEALLGGASFADAVADAREACWAAAPLGKTWAAYQCYGDPSWRWRDANPDAQRAADRPRDEVAAVATPVGLALVLETLATETRFMHRPIAEQRPRLLQFDERFSALWGDIGAVAEAFALAWEACGDLDRAIGWLQRAVQAEDRSASMKAIEQLHNLRARLAWSEVESVATASSEAHQGSQAGGVAAINESLSGLKALIAQQPTVERWSLLGSAHKRRALIERRRAPGPQPGGAELGALGDALAAYRAAEQLARETSNSQLYYPGLNRMALELLCEGPAALLRDDQANAAVAASLAASVRTAPDFWGLASRVEFDLYLALARGRLAAEAPGLQRAWADLRNRVAAVASWRSVADQAALVLPPFAAAGDPATRRCAAALLAQLQAYANGSDVVPAANAPAAPAGLPRRARRPSRNVP